MDILEQNEGKLSGLRICGFVLMLSGLIVITVTSFIEPGIRTPYIISTSFFIIMIGFAFAFPSTLEGNEGLSTMRIIAFMVTNVICMLLLKIGWSPNVDSLEDMGLDWYWMGVIAFVFGAKATQAFFESKFTPPPKAEKSKVGMAAVEFNNADIARLAKDQNEQFLYAKFPNIEEVSDAVYDLNSSESHVVVIYLKDGNTLGIPDRLEVKMPDDTKRTISTEIIKGIGRGSINAHGPRIRNGFDIGSICCMVNTDEGDKVVTAGHVFSKGDAVNYGGVLDSDDRTLAQLGSKKGHWFFQMIDSKTDVALAGFEDTKPGDSIKSFQDHYKVADEDIRKTVVKLVSNASGTRTGYILDYNTAWDINYDDKEVTKNNIIVIGSSKERSDSSTLSKKGDSGGCVYEPVTGKLVGLILGGNNAYTWVLPVDELFEKFNFKLI